MSKIMSVVNLNMVFQVPVWKQENCYLGAHRRKKIPFWFQNRKMPFWDGTPPRCTSNLVYIRAGKCGAPRSSNGIELSWFVQIVLHFYWFWPPHLSGGSRWVDEYLGDMEDAPAHAHICVHAHAVVLKIYMYRNCNWLPSWVSCLLACLTCVCMHVGHPLAPSCPHPSAPSPRASGGLNY